MSVRSPSYVSTWTTVVSFWKDKLTSSCLKPKDSLVVVSLFFKLTSRLSYPHFISCDNNKKKVSYIYISFNRYILTAGTFRKLYSLSWINFFFSHESNRPFPSYLPKLDMPFKSLISMKINLLAEHVLIKMVLIGDLFWHSEMAYCLSWSMLQRWNWR